MSAEREELAKLIGGHESMGCGCCAYGETTQEQSKVADALEVSEYMVVLADAILAAGYRKPRTITNIEECVALADGSVILTKGGIVFRKYVGWFKEGKDGWIRCTFGQNDPLTIESLGYNDYAHFPATVIHEGDTK